MIEPLAKDIMRERDAFVREQLVYVSRRDAMMPGDNCDR
jgi:hypothetical protein